MTNNSPPCRLILITLCILVLFSDATGTAEMIPPGVAVVISQRIRPYLRAANGLRQELVSRTGALIEEFELDRFTGKARDVLAKDLREGGFDLFIAIGPDAARFVWASLPAESARKLYTMVLEPERILGVEESACGIPLGIPPQVQLRILSCGLPTVRRVGILYDPSYNRGFVEEAAGHAPSVGLTIVPLKVSSKRDIPVVLKQHCKGLDALLLIPDRTVISESLVQYVIKESLFEGVAVIGYNRFFYESGAALAFVFDYREIGKQTARLARKMLSGDECEKEPPVFRAWLNRRVMKHLKIPLRDRYLPPLEVGP